MKKFIVLLAILLFLSGCVNKEHIDSTTIKLINIDQQDVDANGFNETKLYNYKIVNVGDYKVEVFASTYPSKFEVGINSYKNPNINIRKILSDQLVQFLETKRLAESSCKVNLGLNIQGNVCTDTKSCLASCYNVACRGIDDYMRKPTGYYIYDFIEKSNKVEQDIIDAKALLMSDNNADKREIVEKISEAKLLISSINANPIFYRKGIGICDPINYPTDLLNTVAFNYADHTYNEEQFNTNFIIKISKDNLGDYEEIDVSFKLPENVKVTKILSEGTYTENNSLKLSNYRLSLNKGAVMSFIATSEDQLGDLESPSIDVSQWVIISSPVLEPYFKMLEVLFDNLVEINYYFAVGVLVAALFLTVLFIYFLIKIVISVIKAKKDNRSIIEVLLDEFGTTDINAQQNLLIGIIMLGVSLLLAINYTQEPLDKTLSVEKILDNVGLDAVGGVVVVLVAFGLTFIYLFIEDAMKGIIIGKRYYLIGINREENKKLYQKLKTGISIAKKKINEAEILNIDVGTEFESILSINQERIENLLNKKSKKHQKEAYRLIIDGLNKVDGAITSIEGKLEVAKINWPEWERYLQKLLATKNVIPIASLSKIPRQWRIWAINKYVDEHPEDTLIIDENTIRRVEGRSKADNYIKNLLNKEQIEGGLAIVRGELKSNRFYLGNISVDTVLGMRIIDYGTMAMKKIGDELKEIEAKGKHNILGVWSNSEGSLLLIIKQKYFDEIKEDIRKKLEGLI